MAHEIEAKIYAALGAEPGGVRWPPCEPEDAEDGDSAGRADAAEQPARSRPPSSGRRARSWTLDAVTDARHEASARSSSPTGQLASATRTVAEVRAFLERKRVEPETIDDAVAELPRPRLARRRPLRAALAEDKRELERWGSRAHRAATCAGAGSPPDLIEAALADAEPRRASSAPRSAPGAASTRSA